MAVRKRIQTVGTKSFFLNPMKNKYSRIPNLISIMRMFSCILYLLIGKNLILFLLLTLFIGASDILDGYVARRYHWESDSGALLDSLGDLVFYISLLIYIFLYRPAVISSHGDIISIAVIVKCLPIVISLVKNRKIAFIHTLLNKLTGIIVITGMVAVVITGKPVVISIMALSAIVSGLEESIIHLVRKNPDKNTKSLLLPRHD